MKELASLHSKLEYMLPTFNGDKKKKLHFFLSDEYQNLLSQIQESNEKLTQRKIALSKVISEVNTNIKKSEEKLLLKFACKEWLCDYDFSNLDNHLQKSLSMLSSITQEGIRTGKEMNKRGIRLVKPLFLHNT